MSGGGLPRVLHFADMPADAARFHLAPDETPAFYIDHASGPGAFVLLGDHAGNAVPRALSELGLAGAELRRHIAWDIGVRALGQALSGLLDAPFVHQRYSRLVTDCNRDPSAPACIAASSDGTVVPGNAALSLADRADRLGNVHAPYHAAIAALLTRRGREQRPTVLVSLHSFTPRLMLSPQPADYVRPWEIGVLHHLGHTRFAQALLAHLRDEPGLSVGDNEPYRMDATDYTVPLHAYGRRLPYAELEVRQDLISDERGVARVAQILARCLRAAHLQA